MADSQFLGPKEDFVYVTDTGTIIKMKRDPDLCPLGTGLAAFDPANPGGAVSKPLGFSPRGVYWQSTAAGFEGRRKFLICGTAAAALYQSDAPQAQEIGGVAGVTTGRRGEQQRFI